MAGTSVMIQENRQHINREKPDDLGLLETGKSESVTLTELLRCYGSRACVLIGAELSTGSYAYAYVPGWASLKLYNWSSERFFENTAFIFTRFILETKGGRRDTGPTLPPNLGRVRSRQLPLSILVVIPFTSIHLSALCEGYTSQGLHI